MVKKLQQSNSSCEFAFVRTYKILVKLGFGTSTGLLVGSSYTGFPVKDSPTAPKKYQHRCPSSGFQAAAVQHIYMQSLYIYTNVYINIYIYIYIYIYFYLFTFKYIYTFKYINNLYIYICCVCFRIQKIEIIFFGHFGFVND